MQNCGDDMKFYFQKVFFIILMGSVFFILDSCHKKEEGLKFHYTGILQSGETIKLKFAVGFNSKESENFAKKREENLKHALNLVFRSHRFDELSKSKVQCALKKACTQVFHGTVDSISILSLRYGK